LRYQITTEAIASSLRSYDDVPDYTFVRPHDFDRNDRCQHSVEPEPENPYVGIVPAVLNGPVEALAIEFRFLAPANEQK
jgi:hypothetical protein